MTRNNFMYDGTFNGNMLAWISKIELSAAREHQIRESFSYASVEFHYPNDVGEFEMILELLKDNKSDANININGEADDLGI